MKRHRRARRTAGAFLFAAALAPAAASAEQIRIVAQRADGACPTGPPFGIRSAVSAEGGAQDPGGCVWLVSLDSLGEDAVREGSARMLRLRDPAALVLQLGNNMVVPLDARLPYAIKQYSSAFRAAAPDKDVFFLLPRMAGAQDVLPGYKELLQSEELAPYLSGVWVRSPTGSINSTEDAAALAGTPRLALSTPLSSAGSAVDDVLRILQSAPAAVIAAVDVAPSGSVSEADWQALQRLQRYLTADVSRDPTATTATRADATTFPVLRFFDAKAFAPILLLPRDASGSVRIALSGGSYTRASVENLGTGARRDFDLGGAAVLTLNLAQGALAVRLQPGERKDATKTQVEVGAERGLTADEIVARERAWEAGQRDAIQSFLAEMDASLRFRVADVNETFDLTIRGPFFFRRGEPPDWAWKEFFVNGVKWKGKTLPKIPILQPEKVTTLPLDIRLTEEYSYELRGEGTVGDRRAYHVAFEPKATVGDRPAYRGSAWIDKETFALLRRESVQLNLKGETLSNVQNEYYRPVPNQPGLFLPLEIRGQQVFSTAGRTTAIERHVTMSSVQVNPPDYAERLAALHASENQMVRDTDRGLRYLVPDPANAQRRIVEEKISRKSTFGLAGAFYDDSLDYPIPLLGLQHFNFDLWGRGKQLSVFFGGALLTGNYTDPSLGGSRFDLGADLFAVAVAFGDPAYREGQEILEEKVDRLPAVLQINVGRPFGPYIKASLGLFTRYDNYQGSDDTAPTFVVPTDTFTDGTELRLVGNLKGFNATLEASYARRRKWEPWGMPGSNDWEERHRDFFQYSLTVSKDHFFRGFRKLHMALSYIGGHDLDRFSKYEFGFFSGNPLRGFKSGSIKTQEAILANLSYGLNIQDIIRFEGFYDQAYVLDETSGFGKEYFSGAGLLASLNGPWANSLVRVEVGVPVVKHGIDGFVVYAMLLKLF